MVCLGRPYHYKFFKDCFPEILLGPFLNTLTHLKLNNIFVVSLILPKNSPFSAIEGPQLRRDT